MTIYKMGNVTHFCQGETSSHSVCEVISERQREHDELWQMTVWVCSGDLIKRYIPHGNIHEINT